jgi:GNAT superfamily N-acetyltransferase
MKTTASESKITYRPATLQDLPGVVSLKDAVWAGRSFEHWERRWKWQFVDHPLRRIDAFDSSFVLAFLEGELVGGIGFMPTTVTLGETEHESAWGCDLFIDPKAQGHGLGKSLIDRIVAAYPNSLWMNYGEAGARSYAGRGFAPVAPVNFMGLPVDPGSMLRGRGRRGLGVLAAWTGPALRTAIRLRLRGFKTPPGVSVAALERFGEEFDGLHRSLCRGRPDLVRPIRTAAYLNWRYADCPYGRHHVRAARQNGELLGYVVFRGVDSTKGRTGLINELEAVDGVSGLGEALAAEAVHSLLDDGANFIKAFPTHASHQALFGRLGFLDTKRTPHLHVAPGAADRLGLPGEGNRWWLSMGDCDLDYA